MKKKSILPVVLLLAALALGAQSVKVKSPNGGESWALNSSQTITWAFANAGSVKVDIVLRNSAGKVGTIQGGVSLAAGSWQWNAVGKLEDGTMVVPGTDYIVRIRDAANTFGDSSDSAFSIAPAMPVIIKFPEHRMPLPFPFGSPKLAVTIINLVRNASGYSIIFGYKNVGNAALPKRHELTVKPDYRVLIDGREIDKGDLFIPESPPAAPGWELATNSGGSINFPGMYDPAPWYMGKEITIILNERNVLNMGSASKTSSLLPVALTVGYDLAFGGPVTVDWDTGTAHVMVTKVGSTPELSREFALNYTVRGYYLGDNAKSSPMHATVTTGPGLYTNNDKKIIPSTGPFPAHLDIPLGRNSLFYELEFAIKPQSRDEFDERNNTLPRVRFDRPGAPPTPHIISVEYGNAKDAHGKDCIRTWVTLLNDSGQAYGAMRLLLERNGSKIGEWKGMNLAAGQRLEVFSDSSYTPMSGQNFIAYLYDGSNQLIDCKEKYR